MASTLEPISFARMPALSQSAAASIQRLDSIRCWASSSGLALRDLGIVGRIEPGQCRMQLDRIATQKAVVGGLADQGMPELELVLRRGLQQADEAGVDQPAEIAIHGIGRAPRQLRQQVEGELPPDDGGDLRQLARIAQGVEPGQQGALQRIGNGQKPRPASLGIRGGLERRLGLG